MAFEVKKIDPLDLQPSKAIGVELPFAAKEVFTPTYQSADAIKTNLINFFLTAKGERYLNPLFGTGLNALLFEQLTDELVKEVETLVINELRIYFPRVQTLEIEVESQEDNHTIQFYLKYRIRDTNIEDEVVINFLQ